MSTIRLVSPLENIWLMFFLVVSSVNNLYLFNWSSIFTLSFEYKMLFCRSYSNILDVIIFLLSSIALEFPLVIIRSWFLKYLISSEKIWYLLISSSIITLPFAFKIFFDLLYMKLSALIRIPLSDIIFPLLFPLNILPSSRISISVTSKSNCCSEKLWN